MRQVKHVALQGRPQSTDFVKTFYLKYGNNGLDFNNFGENATVKYKVRSMECPYIRENLLKVSYQPVGQSVGWSISLSESTRTGVLYVALVYQSIHRSVGHFVLVYL